MPLRVKPENARTGIATVGGRHVPVANAYWQRLVEHPDRAPLACRACGGEGRPVALQTVRAIVQKQHRGDAAEEGFRYCTTLACPVVYYHNGDLPKYIATDEVKGKVNSKQATSERTLCYCLKVSEATVLGSILEGGAETLEDVQRVTTANTGKACHVLNPSGVCCEPQVRAAIAKGLTQANKSHLIRSVGEEGDCCAPSPPSEAGSVEPAGDACGCH